MSVCNNGIEDMPWPQPLKNAHVVRNADARQLLMSVQRFVSGRMRDQHIAQYLSVRSKSLTPGGMRPPDK